MKIAVIIPRLELLGPVKVMLTLVNSLSEYSDMDINLFYLDENSQTDFNVKVPVNRYNPSLFRFSDYDVLHTSGIRPDMIAFINRRKIKKQISTIHNFVFEDLAYSNNRIMSWIAGKLWLLLWRRSDKLVCVSASLKNYYQRWFDSSKLESIHNGLPAQMISTLLDQDILSVVSEFRKRGLKIIGSVSMLSKIKGLDQILIVLSSCPGLAFVVVGSGREENSLKRLAGKLQVEDRVLFCGLRKNGAALMSLFDIFLMPSRSEGFGLALVEAIQQKVPVVCSDISVFKELFNENEVTFFSLDDIYSLKNALHDSLQGKAESAFVRYKQEYTDRIMAKKYHDLYLSLQPENENLNVI